MVLSDTHHYDDMFTMMERRGNQIWIPKEQLGTRLNLDIPFAPCYAAEERRLIFFEYGKLDAMAQWHTVFKTLTESFPLTEPLPSIETIMYWDLLKGTTYETDARLIQPASMERVKIAARTYIADRSKPRKR